MKIALIRRQFSPSGGAELYLARLIDALRTRGHAIHLFAETWLQQTGDISFHPIATRGRRATRPLAFAQAVQEQIQGLEFDCVFSLERTLKQDVYRAGDGVHKVWLERRREFAHGLRKLLAGRGAFHRNIRALEKRTFHPANTGAIIVNSEMVRHEILTNFNFPPDRIHLVRNGIDLSRFAPGDKAKARERFGLHREDYVLLFVGSGWERKGLKLLADEILPRINTTAPRPVRLLVVGKGNSRGLRGENVVFAGVVSDAERAYHAADLFVFLPLYEPSANVCFEALASGLPVVTCKQNGASEIVQESVNGTVLQRPDDIQGAVAAINFWAARKDAPIRVVRESLGMERNVRETLAILEKAARRGQM